MKLCLKCNNSKSLGSFPIKKSQPDGLYQYCKLCKSEADKSYYERNKEKVKEKVTNYYNNNKDKKKEYSLKNRDKLIKNCKEFRENNKEHIKEYNASYKELNKEEIKEQRTEYRKNNRVKINEYNRNRLKTNEKARLAKNLRRRTREILKNKNWNNDLSFAEAIGCDMNHLKSHLESKFKPGMTWDNYGCKKEQWSIDHIKPLIKASTKEEMYKRCHWSNLQPLWAPENSAKGSKE